MEPDGRNLGQGLGGMAGHLERIASALDESSLVAITDRDGNITYANKKFCSISGYSADELAGRNARILKSGFHPDEFYRGMWEAISGGRVWHGQMKNVTRNGEYFWVDMTIVPFLDGDGVPEQYVAICADLTSQKNNEESLLNANMQLRRTARIQKENLELQLEFEKMKERDVLKEEFSAMITHELKTPLVPILGYCKMFRNEMFGRLPGEVAEAVGVIEKNARRLGELIDDIMDSRKLDLGRMKFSYEDLRLEDFFGALEGSYGATLGDRGMRYVTKLSCGDVAVHVDGTRLRQVFDNLISNAMKFVPEKGGIIEVGGYCSGGEVVLYVRDNGIGIPPDKQEGLFGKYYQIDTTLRRRHGGTGLGLSISKGIVESMGGTIWVESDGRTGTTILLKLGQATQARP